MANNQIERGPYCELCGQKAKPKPQHGRLRHRHKCSHGQWCVRGDRLAGLHSLYPRCPDCQVEYQKKCREKLVVEDKSDT